MYGTFYGVGVGPGDPELMTLKAVRIITESDVIAVPGRVKEETVSYQIAKQVILELDAKECLEIDMPMTKEEKALEASHRQGAFCVIDCLKEGKDVAFLTLGDPAVYSTFLYIQRLVEEAGFSTKMVSGIPSFCAAAARLNTKLVEKSETLHIVPSSYPIKEALTLPGVKVLMKAGREMPRVKEQLKESGAEVVMVENCGMEQERICYGADEITPKAGYYSLIIVRSPEA